MRRPSAAWGRVALILPAVLFPISGVLAAPNGLTQIPIAKVFGDGVADFSLARSEESAKTTVYTTQYGIANIIEVGVDYQAAPSEQRTFLSNFKALLAHRPGKLPDMACGLENVATGQKAVPYLVATTQPSATGLSLGMIRPGGSAYYGMVGLDYNISPTVQLVADEIGGRANYSSYGFVASLSKEISLNIAYTQPNSGTNPSGYIVNLAYTFHLKGGGKPESGPASKKPTAGTAGTGH